MYCVFGAELVLEGRHLVRLVFFCFFLTSMGMDAPEKKKDAVLLLSSYSALHDRRPGKSNGFPG